MVECEKGDSKSDGLTGGPGGDGFAHTFDLQCPGFNTDSACPRMMRGCGWRSCVVGMADMRPRSRSG